MNYTFVILTLVFSSLIVLNVTPVYAQTTESPTSASMVCSGSVFGTFDILFDGIWDKWNRYACSSAGSVSGEIVADFETIAHTDSVRIFATGYTWHGGNSVSQKMYYSSDGTNWIYLQDLISRHYNNHGTEYTVPINADLRYIKTTFNISDDWIGLSEIQRTFQIVIDTTPPVITLTGNNPQSIELGDDYTELGATTDDGSPVTIDSSAFSDSLGSYTISYNSVDSADNNAVIVTRTVNVIDTTPPTITAPTNITTEATGQGTSVTLVSATATDHSNFTITNDAPASFPLGITTITWTATDDSENSSTMIQTVTIVDTTPPVITLTGVNPQSIELGIGYTELGAITNDNSPVTIDSSEFSDSLGSYTISYNSVDSSGNNAVTVTRTVTVQETITPDNTPPTITPPPNITLESIDPQSTINIGTATATDNRDSNPTITNNAPNSFPLGVTTITWTATDSSGNISTVTQTVTIIGDNPLIKMDKFFEKMGGLFFGLGIFTIFFLFIGFMASPKTVHIYTIIIMIFAGILNGMGVFAFPVWMWGVMIFMAIVLVFQRRRS